MEITFLGTGTSHGVPPIDCIIHNYEKCPKNVCQESLIDPKHKRSRSSIIIEVNGKKILIDVSADFREQALRENIKSIDAVMITHKHADHIMGIPDIRSYTRPLKDPLPLFGSKETINGLKDSFSYIFDPNTFEGGGIPSLHAEVISSSFPLFDTLITPIPVIHGPLEGCFGYRIGDIAYIPDYKSIPEESMELLKNLKILIIDALRDTREHSTHAILPESIEIAQLLKPEKCYFTHLCHDIHYINDSKDLPEWMSFAYDSLKIKI